MALKTGVIFATGDMLRDAVRSEYVERWRRTHSLRDLRHALSPDPVDGHDHVLPGLHRVEHRALHGRVARAAHRDGHVVLRLKGVLDPLFDVVHDLRSATETRRTTFSQLSDTG